VIASIVAAVLLLPLLMLRGRTLLSYYGVVGATSLFAWLLSLRVPPFAHPDLGFVAVVVVHLATLAFFIAAGRQVRWSANRAALVAAGVYALVVPAMLRAPIDGDEPFYLLQTASIIGDFDLDLANQYRDRTAAQWKRPDIVEAQTGDPRGEHGEQYSRHEPFLAVLMVPGYALFGLPGAVATIALFGVLLVRSTIRWMEDEGISDEAARGVFPLFAFAPPVLYYATRIWPEVPAAFFFVEALRGMREHRAKRWLPALFGLVMLKLRFVLVAAAVVVRRKIAIPLLIVPLAVIWLITGDANNVHTWRELIPMNPMRYLTGLGGLLADGMSGIAFQAPFYLLALVALWRWKKTPAGFRAGMLASLLYLFYLLPRGEWFGGWAPPLRYVVFLMPVLALGIASVWNELSRGAIALISAWTAGLLIHGLASPWRLFHEFTGENALGEWLSALYESDFSRLFPSFIRMNEAAWWGLAAIVVVTGGAAAASAAGFFRPAGGATAAPLSIAAIALMIAIGFHFGRQPGTRVEFEDTHVRHMSGRAYPDPYTLMRATYRGGWVLDGGHEISFLAREGTHRLDFITGLGATFELANRAYTVKPDVRYQSVRVQVPKSGRVTLRCLSGAVNLDRMVLE
jgi:hypothetical protein